MKFLYRLYLFIVCLIFIPFSLFLNKSANGRASYFEDFIEPKVVGQCHGIRCYSLFTYFGLILLTPCLWLSRGFKQTLLNPSRRRLRATPNQVSALVTSQLLGNVRSMITTAKNIKSDYIFALQPTLMDTGAKTEDDKAILKRRQESSHWGFPYIQYFQAYYAKVRKQFASDALLKNHFLDVSRIFVDKKEQRLIDVAHMGNPGQEEMAEVLAKEVLRRVK